MWKRPSQHQLEGNSSRIKEGSVHFLHQCWAEWPASRHRIASVFASWERIAEDFRSENASPGFCIASHRHVVFRTHRCSHRIAPRIARYEPLRCWEKHNHCETSSLSTYFRGWAVILVFARLAEAQPWDFLLKPCVEVAMENAVKFQVKFCCSAFLRKRSSKVPRYHDRFRAILHQTLCSCKRQISWRFSLCRRLSLIILKGGERPPPPRSQPY